MPSEDELPNEIKKLKITPMALTKTQGAALNPVSDDTSNIFHTETQTEENATHTRCRRCRLRRRSESLVDDYKMTADCGSVEVAPTPPHVARLCKHNTLNKHNLKRTIISTSGDRKIYMREPMLRALQRFCTHKQARRKLQSPQEPENNATEQNKCIEQADKFPARGMSDFRDLIEECQSMLKQYKNSDKLPEHQMEQFQCHRTLARGEDNPLELPLVHNINSISEQPQQQQLQQNVVPAARSNVSCSQQAGNSNVPCDDVTIDELASYFDTFVHIPKKMSTMAEMMYI